MGEALRRFKPWQGFPVHFIPFPAARHTNSVMSSTWRRAFSVLAVVLYILRANTRL